MSLFRYILTHYPLTGGEIRYELGAGDGEPTSPQGWEDLDLKLKRDPQLHGVFFEFSETELTFYGKAKDLLKNAFDTEKLSARVTIQIAYSPYSNGEFTELVNGLINFSEYSEEINKVSVTIEQDDLNQLFRTRYDSKFNLVDATTIGGEAVANPRRGIDEITLRSRPIQRKGEVGYPSQFLNNGGLRRTEELVYDTVIVNEYIDGNVAPNTARVNIVDVEHEGDYRVLIYIKWSNNNLFSGSFLSFRRNSDPAVIFLNGSNGASGEFTFEVPSQFTQGFQIGDNFKIFIDILAGGIDIEELRMEFISLSVTDESVTECLQIGQAFEKATERIFDNMVSMESGRFKNPIYLGEDLSQPLLESHKYVLLPGFWLRGYGVSDSVSEIDESKKPFNTSFKKMVESIGAIFPIGVGLQGTALRVDDRSYFYDESVEVDLGEVDSLIKTVDLDKYYSNLKIGYKKFENDEDWDNSLLGIHGEHEYETALTRYEQRFASVSDFIADANSIEVTRRETYQESESRGWKYDKDVFIVSVEFDGGNIGADIFLRWRDRQDEDILSVENLTSPETMYNYNITPKRNARRFLPWIGGGLRPHLDAIPPKLISGEPNLRPSFQLAPTADVEEESNAIAESDDLDLDSFEQFFNGFLYRIEKVIELSEWLAIRGSQRAKFTLNYRGETFSGWLSDANYIPNQSLLRMELIGTDK